MKNVSLVIAFMLFTALSVAAQQITGTVKLGEEPIGGLTVTVDGLKNSAITDNLGRFTLSQSKKVPLTIESVLPPRNLLDTPEYFIYFLYIGLLNRRPDMGGLSFWSGKIQSCGSNAPCIRELQASVIRSFVESAEYRQRFECPPDGFCIVPCFPIPGFEC